METWNRDPIANFCSLLEEKQIYVLIVNIEKRFDGYSATIGRDGKYLSGAIIVNEGTSGERQRFSLAHELAHIIQNLPENVIRENRESFAHRFAGAFLAPKDTFIKRVGKVRKWISTEELLILKEEFGMSIQALIRRMLDSQHNYTFPIIRAGVSKSAEKAGEKRSLTR